MTVAQGKRFLEEAIRIGTSENLASILVIHGQNGVRMAWLNYLQANYQVGIWRRSNLGVSVLYLKELR